MSGPLTGQALTTALTRHLRRRSNPPVVFTEIALEGSWGSRGRLDVVAYRTGSGYSWHTLHGYEVKASRSDLLRDLNAEKWRRYLRLLTGFSFVLPQGLAKVDEIPAEAGLITVNAEGICTTVRRMPRLNPDPITVDTLARLVLRADFMVRQTESGNCARCDKRERAARLKQATDDQVLFALTDQRVKQAIRDLHRREEDVQRRERALQEAEALARGLPEAIDSIRSLLNLAHRAVGTWRPAEATEALAAAVRAAEDVQRKGGAA